MPGTAYGRKIASRENAPNRIAGVSSSSARSSAAPSIVGTSRIP